MGINFKRGIFACLEILPTKQKYSWIETKKITKGLTNDYFELNSLGRNWLEYKKIQIISGLQFTNVCLQ
jgi:hypothetical protein